MAASATLRREPDPMSASPPPDRPDPKEVPLFGTWTSIYAAIVASAVLVMALVALFSGWPY
jgi:hypothetical protein